MYGNPGHRSMRASGSSGHAHKLTPCADTSSSDSPIPLSQIRTFLFRVRNPTPDVRIQSGLASTVARLLTVEFCIRPIRILISPRVPSDVRGNWHWETSPHSFPTNREAKGDVRPCLLRLPSSSICQATPNAASSRNERLRPGPDGGAHSRSLPPRPNPSTNERLRTPPQTGPNPVSGYRCGSAPVGDLSRSTGTRGHH